MPGSVLTPLPSTFLASVLTVRFASVGAPGPHPPPAARLHAVVDGLFRRFVDVTLGDGDFSAAPLVTAIRWPSVTCCPALRGVRP